MRRAVAACAVLLALGGATAVVAPAASGTAAVLHVGSDGPRVSELQHRLTALGHFTYPRTTGHFGERTRSAVKAFQRAHGMKVTGRVTGAVWSAIGDAYRVGARSTPAASAAWQDCTVTLGGVRVRTDRTQRTRTVVDGTGGSHAAVSFYARTDSACGFRRIFATDGRVGYGGIADGATRVQGSGTTPAGTYTMTEAFGHDAAPATAMPYRRAVAGDWWVEDNESAFYNTYRNASLGGFALTTLGRNSSELLADFMTEYAHAVVINFNRAPDVQRRYRGAGIFLHVNGSGATAGCVSVGRSQVRTVLTYLKPGDRITIVR